MFTLFQKLASAHERISLKFKGIRIEKPKTNIVSLINPIEGTTRVMIFGNNTGVSAREDDATTSLGEGFNNLFCSMEAEIVNYP